MRTGKGQIGSADILVFKSYALEGVNPCLLQNIIDLIFPQLDRIFMWRVIFGHIPSACRGVKVVFIPKIGY